MTRYFMTIPEAAAAGAAGRGDGQGRRDLRARHGRAGEDRRPGARPDPALGLRPGEDIEIVFTGLRPGEKLFEELEHGGEQIAKTRHPKIFIGDIAKYSARTIQTALDQFAALAKAERTDDMRQLLSDLLPEADLRVKTAAKAEPAPAAMPIPMPVPAMTTPSDFERYGALYLTPLNRQQLRERVEQQRTSDRVRATETRHANDHVPASPSTPGIAPG